MVKTPSSELVVPGTGELVNLEDLPEVARALSAVKHLESLLREAKGTLQDAVRYHAAMLGVGTIHVPDVGKMEIRGGVEIVYDAEEIERGLRQAGMPEERIREIVEERVTYQVKAVEAKRAAKANALYAAVIANHSRTVEKRPTVSGP